MPAKTSCRPPNSRYNPVEIVPGIRTDPRSAVATLAGAFGGPVAAVMTGTALASLRFYFGGLGDQAGALSIIGATIASVIFWYIWQRVAQGRADRRYVSLQATSAAIVPTIVLLLTSKADAWTFGQSVALFAPTNFLAAYLFGRLLLRDQERHALALAHEETQAQLTTIANNAPVVLFQMARGRDGNPRFRFVSHGAWRVFGVSPHELRDEGCLFRRIISEGDGLLFAARLAEADQKRAPWSIEAECIRPDKRIVWVRFDAEPRVDGSGTLVWDGTATDVTSQKQSERMKDEFISIVSHELRTPLTSIRGSLGLIASGKVGELPAKMAGLAKIAHQNSERLVMLVNDILDMEKIKSGKLDFSLKEIAIGALLKQAVAANAEYLPDKEIEINLVDATPNAAIVADPDRLHQVLSNLLSNAIKFSPAGSIVTVSTELVDDAFLRMSVRDEGPGIPEDFRDRIFSKFEQADSSSTRKTGGTGLGLNISKAIVEKMDGRITFETCVGKGTTFYVDLPLSKSPTRNSTEKWSSCGIAQAH
ncbi:ATP-binding protein [Consotaella aegiceratis]|uniref:ATP-binding protein n=1 Tax=Consotaella aegiceratis TaxID=3097961 RepID=UPI002F3F592C